MTCISDPHILPVILIQIKILIHLPGHAREVSLLFLTALIQLLQGLCDIFLPHRATGAVWIWIWLCLRWQVQGKRQNCLGFLLTDGPWWSVYGQRGRGGWIQLFLRVLGLLGVLSVLRIWRVLRVCEVTQLCWVRGKRWGAAKPCVLTHTAAQLISSRHAHSIL